ncbi:MAG: radical SAM protein [Candidatus Vogelbacteria bacterium]|nr:radical SAM protein [Candidatus Vogelbacteria bacterium]
MPVDVVSALDYHALEGLKILYLNMPLRESAKPNNAPLGPGLLASRTRMYGAEVSILDLNAYRLEDEAVKDKPNGRWLTYDETSSLLERHINQHGEPDIIALSGMITTLRWQQFVVSTCRQLVPDAFIISGGGLATDIKTGLFNWIPELDAVVRSEGDDVILLLGKDVLEARLHQHRDMSHLPQCLGEQNGRLRFLYEGSRPPDLDILPFPAWDLLHQDVLGNSILEQYIQVPIWGLAANNSSATPFQMTRSMNTVATWGCPYACKFCHRGATGSRLYDLRSPEKLAEEASWLQRRYGIDFLGFVDDNFAVNPTHIACLPEAFKPLGGLRWGTHTRLDEASDDRVFDMAKAGCIYIGFGAESASEHVLEEMGKGGFILRPRGSKTNQLSRINGFDFPTTMVKGIQNCQAAGIHGNCTWIMAYPGERLEDLKTTVGFILWQMETATSREAVNQKIFVFTAYPGTEALRAPRVQQQLRANFGLSFDACGSPVADNAMLDYVLELDDATKVMHDRDGRPLNFGAMSEDQFLQAREHVDRGNIEGILDM